VETVYYTPKEVAERLRLRVQTVYDYIRKGRLPAVRLGNRCRIAQSDLEAFLERQKNAPQGVSTREELTSVPPPVETDVGAARGERRERLLRLLDEWMADESGYDERAWPIARKVIEENRLSFRRRFDD
jgi:excisionase family DNA binding protein